MKTYSYIPVSDVTNMRDASRIKWEGSACWKPRQCLLCSCVNRAYKVHWHVDEYNPHVL